MSLNPFPIVQYNHSSVLGHGAFGVVQKFVFSKPWFLNSLRLPNEVAVKIINQSNSAVDYFQQELKNLVRINENGQQFNLVQILGTCKIDGNPAFVMELLPMNLHEFVDKTEDSKSLTKSVGKQLAIALQYLHQLNLVHRDVKPDNILVKPMQDSVQVKLTDLGISRHLPMTQATITANKGTDLWMAPEVAKITDPQEHKSKYGHPADVYGYGLVLVFVHTKQYPLGAQAEEKSLLDWIKDLDIQSHDLKGLIDKCLKYCPKDRIRKENLSSHAFFQEKKIPKDEQFILNAYRKLKLVPKGSWISFATIISIIRMADYLLSHEDFVPIPMHGLLMAISHFSTELYSIAILPLIWNYAGPFMTERIWPESDTGSFIVTLIYLLIIPKLYFEFLPVFMASTLALVLIPEEFKGPKRYLIVSFNVFLALISLDILVINFPPFIFMLMVIWFFKRKIEELFS